MRWMYWIIMIIGLIIIILSTNSYLNQIPLEDGEILNNHSYGFVISVGSIFLVMGAIALIIDNKKILKPSSPKEQRPEQ